MQIALSKRGDYAVRAMIDLARHPGAGRRKAREIAAATDVPPKFLPQILAALAQAELVDARAGRDGGYRLGRAPADISLLDVIRAVEPADGERGCLLWGRPCRQTDTCAIHAHWTAAQDALNQVLARTRFADLVGDG